MQKLFKNVIQQLLESEMEEHLDSEISLIFKILFILLVPLNSEAYAPFKTAPDTVIATSPSAILLQLFF